MKSLFIIDGYLHIHRAYHAPLQIDLTSPSGEPTKATYIFTTALLKLIREEDPDMLAVAMEGRTKTFRCDLSSEYKANRSLPSSDFIIQRDRIEQILEAMNIPIIRMDGYEADDIIGTVSRLAQQDGHEVFICSKDKDMQQLLSFNARMLDMKTGKYTTIDDLAEKHGIWPRHIIDVLALQGDSTDNIPGVPSIGFKTAADWIRKYDSVEGLFEHIDDIKGKKKEKLLEFKDQILLNKKLTTIDCCVPIKVDFDELNIKEYDRGKLLEIFTELGFNSLISQLSLV